MNINLKKIQTVILPVVVCVMTLTLLNSFFVEEAYPGEPDNQSWFMGSKIRDGIRLFIPGDVPQSNARQKRTAEYKVQKLTMGVGDGNRPYNSAFLAVNVPKKEDNHKRGIPVEKMEERKMKATETFFQSKVTSEESHTETSGLKYIYITDRVNNRTSIYNIQNGESQDIPAISTSTTLQYFGKQSEYDSDITLTLQGTIVRFSYYHMFLRRWGGPISAVIRILPNDLETTIELIQQSSFPSRIIFDILLEQSEDYPINYMRNLAIKAVATSHFFVADMDVWPTPTLYSHVMSILNPTTNEEYNNGDNLKLMGEVLNREKSALIVPVYEYMKACSSFTHCVKERENQIPTTKTMLRQCLDRKICRQFREGQNLHNYYFDEWLYDEFEQPMVKVVCFVKDKQEPYLILRKSTLLPYFDERFINYGYNKVQWVTHLRYSGFRFYVLGTDFAMDVAHPRSQFQKNFLSTMREKHITLNQGLYSSFMNEILRKSRASVTRTCGKGGLEVDVEGSVDF